MESIFFGGTAPKEKNYGLFQKNYFEQPYCTTTTLLYPPSRVLAQKGMYNAGGGAW